MTHPMERLLTTGADSHRRIDSKQAMMAYLVSVSCEPAGGLHPSASGRFAFTRVQEFQMLLSEKGCRLEFVQKRRCFDPMPVLARRRANR